MSLSQFSLYWDVQNSGKYTGTPVSQIIRNDLDAHGSILDLKRLPAETNYSYYKRLQTVIPLRGGSDHDGLVHALTRELGLEEFIGLIISPVQSGGQWLAPSPYIEITATELILYSSYVDAEDNTIDLSVDIFDHGSGYLLEDLLTQIQTSEFFVAELGSDMTGSERSSGLFPGSSSSVISKEWVPSNSYFSLEHTDIMPGTLYFTEKEIFSTEISIPMATNITSGQTITWAVSTPVTRDGEYFVDYKTGLVTATNSASGHGTCRYIYREFPWYIRWSPISVYSLRDDNYRDKVFEDETMLDNSTKQGLVTSEGAEVYRQVFERSPCLWGD
jgi:hypothetical protein